MKNKKKLGLTTLIFIALIAGAITGIIINYCIPSNKIVDDFIVSGLFYVVGQGFIRLMRMLVVPLVFCSIVCGSMAVGDTKKLGSVGLKTMLFYLCTTALAVVVALCIANVINPGIGLDMSAIKITSKVTESTQATSVTETLLNIIPTNIFESLANGTMLQIILFALILGVILANMSDRVDIVKNFFSQFNDIMMEMTMMVMGLAPIGVFLVLYLGLGILFEYILKIEMGFYSIPIVVIFLVALLVACFQNRKLSFDDKLAIMGRGIGDKTIVTMILIFMAAGIFVGTVGRNSAESVAYLMLSFIPPEFAVAVLFVVSCFVSLAMGTSVGTITLITPISVAVSAASGFDLPLCVASVMGGAMFGDNLSFISDTTIAACQGQGCAMKDKFRENFRIALPAALASLAIILVLSFNANITGAVIHEY